MSTTLYTAQERHFLCAQVINTGVIGHTFDHNRMSVCDWILCTICGRELITVENFNLDRA